nr:Chain P, Insulin receptor substrate 1 [Rattus norvegicus]
GYMPMSPG